MTTGQENTDGPAVRRWRRLLAPFFATAAVVAGIAAIVSPRQEVGWFAYAPLANQTFISDQFVLMDNASRAGYVLIVAGLLTLAFWWGYRLGLRRNDS